MPITAPTFPVQREPASAHYTLDPLLDGTYYTDPIELGPGEYHVGLCPVLALGSGAPSDAAVAISAQVLVDGTNWKDLYDATGSEQWALAITTDFEKAVHVGDESETSHQPTKIVWRSVRFKVVVTGTFASAGDATSSLNIYVARA